MSNNNDESIWKTLDDDSSSPLSPSSADEHSEHNKFSAEDSSTEKTISDDNINDTDEEPMLSRRKFFILGGMTIVAAIPLGLGSGYLYNKSKNNNQASSQLSDLKKTYGPITPVNTNVKSFSGQKLENVNIDQKSLTGGNNNTASDAAVFIFSNGKKENRRIVDVYIDFDSQVSRDFLLINQLSLKNMIENGLIELRIHPVSSGSALSIYSPEAIAESFVKSPELSWGFMMSLLKLSAEVQADGDIEILPAIEEKIAENGIQEISAESIQNGTFSSWILAVGDDEKLQTGYYPPIIYVNEAIVDPEVVQFNDTDAVRRHILSFDVEE